MAYGSMGAVTTNHGHPYQTTSDLVGDGNRRPADGKFKFTCPQQTR